MTRAWTRSCAACSVRKGLIFLMLCSANLQDRAVFAMCSLKVSRSSKITPRFLTEADGVIVDEPNCRVGVAGKTRSSVFARLSCRWCSFIHAEMSARQPEIRAATVGSSDHHNDASELVFLSRMIFSGRRMIGSPNGTLRRKESYENTRWRSQ